MNRLIDILKTADAEAIIQAQDCDRFEPLPGEEAITEQEKIEIYTRFIDMLCQLTPSPNPQGKVILCCNIRDSYMNQQYLDTAAYDRDDILSFSHICPLCIGNEAETLSDEEIAALYEERARRNRMLPVGYAYEFSEWEDVLGWEIDEDNMNTIGKNRFLAAVLYELSFNGFQRESHDERKRDLDERYNEVKAAMELPEEEREKHFIKAEDVFNQLADETDDESLRWTPPTDEERAEIKRLLNRDWLWNSREKAKSFIPYIRNKNRELLEKYPFLEIRDVSDEQLENNELITALDFIPRGWRKVYGMLICEDIRRIFGERAAEFRFEEIKEKYGSLRMYGNMYSPEWNAQLHKYEHLTEQTCIECGKIGVPLTAEGWILPLCEDCYEKNRDGTNRRSYKMIVPDDYEFDPVFTVIRYSKNGKETVQYNCDDILERVDKQYL